MRSTLYASLPVGGVKPTAKIRMTSVFWGRLGYRFIAVIYLGLCVLIAMNPILASIWFCDERYMAWRYLVENEWLDKFVTLAALVIRIMVSTQSSVAISMAAAILLESPAGILLPEVANVLIMRSESASLWSVLRMTINIVRSSPSLATVMMSLLLSATILQFTSTFLLSDFKTIPAFTTNRTSQYKVMYDDTTPIGVSEAIRYWSFPPSSSPLFAEQCNRSFTQWLETVVDTGLIVRASLPLSSQVLRLMHFWPCHSRGHACSLSSAFGGNPVGASNQWALMHGYITPSTTRPPTLGYPANRLTAGPTP